MTAKPKSPPTEVEEEVEEAETTQEYDGYDWRFDGHCGISYVGYLPQEPPGILSGLDRWSRRLPHRGRS